MPSASSVTGMSPFSAVAATTGIGPPCAERPVRGACACGRKMIQAMPASSSTPSTGQMSRRQRDGRTTLGDAVRAGRLGGAFSSLGRSSMSVSFSVPCPGLPAQPAGTPPHGVDAPSPVVLDRPRRGVTLEIPPRRGPAAARTGEQAPPECHRALIYAICLAPIPGTGLVPATFPRFCRGAAAGTLRRRSRGASRAGRRRGCRDRPPRPSACRWCGRPWPAAATQPRSRSGAGRGCAR